MSFKAFLRASKYAQPFFKPIADAAETPAHPLGIETLGLVDQFVDDSSLWMEAMGESLRLGHSSYDMFYFALARRLGATLFTLDKKLQKLCAANGVNCIWVDDEF